MILKMKYTTSYAEADRLIEKYYDGLTTGAEEKQLQQFLKRTDLPEKYRAEQAIFGYFDLKKGKKQISLRPYMRWVAVAAVVLLVIAGPQLFVSAHPSDFAYIDGKRVSDIREVKSHALASLGVISSSKDEVQESLKNINDTKLIEQQLDVFSK